MEGQRSTAMDFEDSSTLLAQTILDPTPRPLINTSIAISRTIKVSADRGTLGGYVLVDGVVMGLINHHVAFGNSRLEAFPTAEEEASRVSYSFMQPAEGDLEQRIKDCKIRREYSKKTQKAEDTTGCEAEISSINSLLAKLEPWMSEKSVLGTTWRSSGIRAREGIKDRRFRPD